jgi:hypothetical protein
MRHEAWGANVSARRGVVYMLRCVETRGSGAVEKPDDTRGANEGGRERWLIARVEHPRHDSRFLRSRHEEPRFA